MALRVASLVNALRLSAQSSSPVATRRLRPGLGHALAMGAVLLGMTAVPALAQTNQPILLPNTYSTVAGGATTATTAGTACVPGSRYLATDIYGNGCPATQALLGQDLHQGVVVDGEGNIFINDSNNFSGGSSVQMVRKVDAKTGIITSMMSSNNSLCPAGTTSTLGSTDNNGDGCAFSNAKHAKERGLGIDPYGNVFISGFGSTEVRVMCNAVSPLCPIAAGVAQTYATAQKQVGFIYRVAGCVPLGTTATAATTSTAAGTAGDGYFATSFWNLPGDITAWGANNASFNGAVTAEGTNGTCGATTGGINGPRAVTADVYGNVYIHDGANLRVRVIVGPPTFTLPSGVVLTNPIPAIIKLNTTYASVTAAQMYGRIYPLIGGYTATVAASACPASASFTAKDTFGDNCPWFNTSTPSANPIGVGISPTGDVILMDGSNKLLRVLYIGATVATSTLTSSSVNPIAYAIFKNNSTLATITQGNVYVLAGGGGTGQPTTPNLGTSTNLATGSSRLAVAPNGNIFIGSGSNSLSSLVGFYDLSTGYIRTLFASSGGATGTITVDGASQTAYWCTTGGVGDGSAAYTSAAPTNAGCFQDNGTGSGTLGVAADAQNNVYIADSEPPSTGGNISQTRIRKVLAGSLYPSNVGSSTTQTLRIHSPAGTTAGATTVSAALTNAPAAISTAAPACNAALYTDTTEDCFEALTIAPTKPGLQSATVTLTPTGTGVAAVNYPLSGLVTGSALVADPNTTGAVTPTATTSTLGTLASGATPVSIALDTAGDVFTIDTTNAKFTMISSGGTVTQLGGTTPTNASQIALDPAGNLYAVSSTGSSVTKLALTTTGYAASSTSITVYDPASTSGGTLSPVAIAFDAQGNLFVATTTTVYQVPVDVLTGTFPQAAFQPNAAIAGGTGYTAINNLAFDGFGNLIVSDNGAGKIIRVDSTATKTTLATSVTPAAIAADAAGNVYYQDSSLKTVTAIPFSGASATVLSSITTPSGLAVAGNGNIYSADSGTAPGSITLVSRSALAFNFGTISTGNTGSSIGLTLNNVGNLAATGYAETDASEFPFTTGTTNGCNTIPSVSSPLAAGAGCTVTANFVPANGTSAVAGVASLLAAATTTGSVTLSGTESGATAPTTTTSITGPSTAVYSATGTEATFTVTVVANNSGVLTGGTVNVSIDGGATSPYVLDANNQASVPVTGRTVGASHTINATFPSQSISAQSYGTSTSGPSTFAITQASTSVSWTPGAGTQQYSAPIGTSVLNATATSSGNAVPGTFVYTANGTQVNAASYLAIGTYTLGVTFYPTDGTDYASTTGSSSGYSVTKATTTAGLGATQNVVGASNSNFTSVQTAINSLSATNGGSIYILPGTYTGTFTVVAPNVAMRGLGGDPTAITLTHSFGAFSPGGGASGYAGEFQASGENNGFTGDEGSSTLVVARAAISGYNGGATTTPTGFYADNLTLQNSYNFDTTTTTTYQNPAGANCTTGNAPLSYASLYNSNQQCASQALAIWITADQAVLNNVYFTSGQDTIYAGSISTGSALAARQFYFRGKVTGNIDYIFGDAAAVFDRTTIYTTYHRSLTGNATITAQNKAQVTGSAGDYLSGYVFNSAVLTSQSSGMTSLYFARPYGVYSTAVMLNTAVDQVVNAGYEEFSGQTNLPTSTYVEYNNSPYTDPATGTADANGVIYLGTGGSTGTGAITNGTTVVRETLSANPGTIQVASGGFQTNYPSLANTTLSVAEAQQYYPIPFLTKSVPTNPYNNGVNVWDPTAAIATKVNAFVNGGVTSATYGSLVTILMRPQTPGLGAVTNGVYTIPTGTYSLLDGATVIASGNLDASGEAYFQTSSLSAGAHSLTWTYGGDSNFNGSTSSTFTLTIGTAATTTTLSPSTQSKTYGQVVPVTVTAGTSVGYTPTGNVTISVDGVAGSSQALSGGATTFNLSNLNAGSHTFSASYAGDSTAATSSSTTSVTATIAQAVLTVTASCSNRLFDQPNIGCGASVTGYQYSDSVSNVFGGIPGGTTSATRVSPVGSYAVNPSNQSMTPFGATNYTLNSVSTNFTITGGTPQTIIFAALPNFPAGGTYQLTARTTSGLPVTYTVTSGNGTISNGALTVTAGSGATVTVQATSPADAAGDYAAATPVSRSFVAQ